MLANNNTNPFSEFSCANTLVEYLNKFINGFTGRWIGLLLFILSNILIGIFNITFTASNIEPIQALIIISSILWVNYYIGYKVDIKINGPKGELIERKHYFHELN